MSDEYDGMDEEDEDIKWRNLDPKQRAKFLRLIFEDDDWYDGTPFHLGGDTNPDFQTVCDRSGAPMSEVKRYYASWLSKQGFDPKRAQELEKPQNVMQSQPTTQQLISGHQPTQTTQQSMQMPDMFNEPDPMEKMLENQMTSSGGKGEGMNMVAMMGFLTSQQRMQMQQQQFQMQMMMQQRQFDQQREADMRREQMARDQQFMNQQTTLLRESFKRASDGGFQGEMQQALEEKMIDELINGKETNWADSVKDVLASDTLKEAVGGLGGALMAARGAPQQQVPAGYDMSDYNPYAQPMPQAYQPQPIQQPMQQYPQQPQVLQESPEQLDGVFFEDQPTQPTRPAPPPQMTADEYNQILMQSFSELLGPAMQDPQVAKAVEEQIEVAVDVTMLEMPEALPQVKLQSMSEKMLLVRNLRDICFGLRDLRGRTPMGEAPGGIVMAAVVSELKKRPEFYAIFANNTYEELVAQLEPFKETGAIKYDYDYLLKPEIADIARHLLGAVAADAQQ